MFLLNLTLAQFLALAGALSAVVVALYLLDRSRRRQTVPTLRFWVASQNAPQIRRRKRIQQPLSLLLQLLSLALLLLAVAQLRFGAPGPSGRDHVLILDTSAWMAAQSAKGTLMDEARSAARSYLRALPSTDRLMLVRADALATPATGFLTSRQALEKAVAESYPGATALNLEQAFEFARQAQKLQGSRSGEIAFVGAGRISAEQAESSPRPPLNLRVLPVAEAVSNCGIRKIGLRRSLFGPDSWEVLVGVRNYGTTPRTVPLVLTFGGAPVGTRRLTLAPGSEQNAGFQFRTRAAGLLEARLLIRDAFREDDRAVLELPQQRALKVVVYSEEPELLRPVLAADPQVEPLFRSPSQYSQPAPGAAIMIFDRFRPQPPPEADAIWLEPPPGGSPVPVRAVRTNVLLTSWRSEHPLASGLRAKDLHLESAQIFEAAPGDVQVAEVEGGPVIVARPGKYKTVVLGFHPGRAALRYELTTPLLFANILRWMSPEIFRRWELNAGSVGTVNVTLGPEAAGAAVRVLSENGSPLPHTIQGRNLRFFAAAPGTVRVLTGDREQVYSLTLPEVAEARWEPPKEARRGIPRAARTRLAYTDLWPWLALAGGALLLLEWLLFGWRRLFSLPSRDASRLRSRAA